MPKEHRIFRYVEALIYSWTFSANFHPLSTLTLPGAQYVVEQGHFSEICYQLKWSQIFGLQAQLSKGQIKPKRIGKPKILPKKQMDEFDLFAVKSKKTNKTNSSVPFLGESMAR